MKYEKKYLLKIFKTYSEASVFFGISRQAICKWEYIPELRLYQLERKGLIDLK